MEHGAEGLGLAADEAEALGILVRDIRACRACIAAPLGAPLPHAPRPVLQVSSTARVLVASQAPGTKVHLSGRPFTDASGERLRSWMGIGPELFYDAAHISIAPMGFCFPGQDAKGSDLPPRRECARLWHDRLFAALPPFELILAIGRPAQRYHLERLGLAAHLRGSLTQTVAGWRELRAQAMALSGARIYALPHPSWRNTGWLKRHPWFEEELVPELRADLQRALAASRPGVEVRFHSVGPVPKEEKKPRARQRASEES